MKKKLGQKRGKMLRAYVRCKNIAIFCLVEMTFKLLGEVELQMGKAYTYTMWQCSTCEK